METAMSMLTVLVVQPNKKPAHAIVKAIEAAGHRVWLCSKETNAISDYKEHACDAAIIHVTSRKPTGLSIAQRIRELPMGNQSPIILTANANTNPLKLEKLAEQVRATAFVLTDENTHILARLLEDIIHRSPTKPSAHTHPGTPAQDEDVIAHTSVATSREQEERHTKVEDEPENEDSSRLSWEEHHDQEAQDEGIMVEEQARLIEKGIELQGNFLSTPFPSLLRTFAELRISGALAVSQHENERGTTTGGKPRKIVYFKNGIPVYVQSNLINECLGRLLIRLGKITPHVLDQSVHLMQQEREKQGLILIRMGALTEEELNGALREQLRRKLFDLFGWRNAAYQFSTDIRQLPDVIALEMNLAEVIFEGVVRKITPQRLLRVLEPHMDRFVVPNPTKAEVFLNMDLVEEARTLLLHLDGTNTLRTLLQQTSRRPGAAAQLLYAMSSLGAVSFETQPQPSHMLEEHENTAAKSPHGDSSTSQHSTTAEAPMPHAPEPFESTEVTSGETPNQRPRSKIQPIDSTEERQASSDAHSESTHALNHHVELTFQAERLFRTGKKMLEQHKLKQAFALFTRAESLCPDEPEFTTYRAYVGYLATPQNDTLTQQALENLAHVIQREPASYEAHLFRARILASLEGFEEAQAAYRQAITVDPTRNEAKTELKQLELKSGNR